MESKGQIQYIVLILAVIVAIVILAIVPDLFKDDKEAEEVEESSGQSTYIPQTPVGKEESTKLPVEETPVSPPASADFTAPYRFNFWPAGGLAADTRKVSMSLQTNEKAACRYATVSGFYYEYMQHTFAETNSTFHSTLITGLNEGMGYVYYVRCIDEQGNKNIDDSIINFYVRNPDDFTPPERRHPYPSGDVFPVGISEITISVSTDEPAYCRYSTQQGVSYNSMSKRFSEDEGNIFHTAKIKSLGMGSYEYFVRCKDLKGNINTGDVMIYFSVE